MNVSPHHQRPTKYPWPGRASGAAIVLGLVLVVLIGFVLVADPFGNDNEERDPAPTQARAAQRF